MRHCIHYKMMTSNAIYRYEPQRHISVSRIGCYSAIIAATRKLLKKIIYVLGAFALFQLLTSLMSRAVQTALSGGSMEDREERFMSWIFGRSPMTKGTVEEVSDSEQSPLLEEETEETEED
uniref:Uncharacterized protein n=1 Tax=Timema cristinae TaxID=61476 RepID=A0A7R9DL59_TIMCR|nr:unnamed protein product [Timema cristinae]